jgi:UDP-N-acetylmuramoylalanine--D-glutamate ligase
MTWNGRKALVLGLGDTGLSMARWLAQRGARVRVADSRTEPPYARTLAAEHPDIEVTLGAFQRSSFEGIDAIAISPGIDPRHPVIADSVRSGVRVVGDMELFAQGLEAVTAARKVARPKVLAITGTNGKSTVTAMAGAVARAAGRATIVAGNIGVPVLDALAEIEQGAALPDVFALELSSFQLESTASLAADAATVLNITEDHLDRYDDLAAYAAAKARIFEGAGAQVLNRDDAWSMGMARDGVDRLTFGLDAPRGERDWGLVDATSLGRSGAPVMPLDELPIAGLHNAANALAALALGDAIRLDPEAMARGLRAFRGLPHRLEKVLDIRDIGFFDDSKGTNVGATVAALNGMTRPVVLIAGGDGKGQDFSPLAPAVSARARAVVLIGRDAHAIAGVLAATGVRVLHAGSMEEAVETAYRAARSGDAVLLSPACASYDMFRSYVHRGQLFGEAVRALSTRVAP